MNTEQADFYLALDDMFFFFPTIMIETHVDYVFYGYVSMIVEYICKS